MRVETDFVDHPRRSGSPPFFKRAAGGGVRPAGVDVLSRFCPTGHVRDIDGTALEAACRWRGQPGAPRSAREVRVARGVEGRRLGSHDWSDHQGKVAQRAKSEKKAGLPREEGGGSVRVCPAHVPRDVRGHPAQRDVTGRDVTGRDVDEEEGIPARIVEKVRSAFCRSRRRHQPPGDG